MIIAASALLMFGCNSAKYSIEGRILDAEKVALLNSAKEVLMETVAIDGSFAFNGDVDVPAIATLQVNGEDVEMIFLEKGEINVNQKETGEIVIGGTPSNDAYAVYNTAINQLVTELRSATDEETQKAVYEKAQQLITSTFAENKENLFGVFLLADELIDGLEPDSILVVVAEFPAELQQTEELKKITEMANKMMLTAVGSKFIEVVLPDADGNELALSSYVGEGKYVLLDFWASWCGPCIGEAPHLVEAYKEYNAKGFEIYAVSLDGDKEAWLKSIKDLGFDWVNVSVLKGWDNPAAKDYSVRGIPSNFLLDPSGVIVARNLRGAELTSKLAELIK